MSENDDSKALKVFDDSLELLEAEKAYVQEKLADKRSSIVKARYLVLRKQRIDRDIAALTERRRDLVGRIAWEQRIAGNLATTQ